MCDILLGGAWILIDVWDVFSEFFWLVIILFFFFGGGLDCFVGFLKSDDFWRVFWWGLIIWGFSGLGLNGFCIGVGGFELLKILEVCRFCWFCLRCVGVVFVVGVFELKILDLFRVVW